MSTGNPFTSAQAPAYNLIAPDIGAEQAKLTRQQQMADILRQQSLQPMGNTEMVSGWAVKKSPWESVTKLAQALGASYAQKSVDQKQVALAKAMQERTAGMFGLGGESAAAPSPSAPSSAPAMPMQPQDAPIDPMQVTEGAMAHAPSMGAQQPEPQAPQQSPMLQQPQAQQRNLTLNGMSPQEAFRAYAMDPNGYMSSYLKQYDSTDMMKNDRYLGISAGQSKEAELAKRLKEGTMSSQPGQTSRLPNGQMFVTPDFKEGIAGGFDANGSPVAREIQGSSQIAATRAGAVAAAQEAPKLLPLSYVGQDGRPIGGTTGEYLGGGAPSGPASGAPPQMPQNGAPAPAGAPRVDLNNMTPDQRTKLMQQAEKQFGLRPGAAPGRSALQSKTEAEEQAAMVKLRTEPQIVQKTQEYKDMADYGRTLDGHVSESQALLQRIGESRDALTKFKAGGGAENRAKLASTAQALGLPDDLVNKIAGGDLAAAQVFQKFAAQEALGTMQQALASDSGKGSQGNRMSMELFIKNNPNITTDPNAIEKVFNFITKQAEQTRAQQEAYHEFKNNPRNDPSSFPAFWAGESIKRGFVNPVQSTGNAKGTVAPANIQSLLDKYK